MLDCPEGLDDFRKKVFLRNFLVTKNKNLTVLSYYIKLAGQGPALGLSRIF